MHSIVSGSIASFCNRMPDLTFMWLYLHVIYINLQKYLCNLHNIAFLYNTKTTYYFSFNIFFTFDIHSIVSRSTACLGFCNRTKTSLLLQCKSIWMISVMYLQYMFHTLCNTVWGRATKLVNCVTIVIFLTWKCKINASNYVFLFIYVQLSYVEFWKIYHWSVFLPLYNTVINRLLHVTLFTENYLK